MLQEIFTITFETIRDYLQALYCLQNQNQIISRDSDNLVLVVTDLGRVFVEGGLNGVGYEIGR